jgi:hypothetical protein
MTTLVAFIVELLTSTVQLVFAFVDIMLIDPLSAISFVVGQVFLLGASAALGYLALGALADLVGDTVSLPSGGPPQQE